MPARLARARLDADAKLAFAGDEGAGLSLGIDSAVYAEEERGREASDDSDDDTRPSTARCAPHGCTDAPSRRIGACDAMVLAADDGGDVREERGVHVE